MEKLTPEEMRKALIIGDDIQLLTNIEHWQVAEAQLAKCQKQDVCPECRGGGEIYIEITPWKANTEPCPTCQGRKQDPEKEEKDA